MNYAIVFDISTVVWDRKDFQNNTRAYFELKNDIIQLFDKIESERPPVLMRKALLSEIIAGFPFDELSGSFSIFKNLVYSFLGKIGSDIIQYNPPTISGLTSNPVLLKNYYSPPLNREVCCLMNEMHTNVDRRHVYFTFKYLWSSNASLKTIYPKGQFREHDTIISEGKNELAEFLDKLKKVFIASPKHHAGKKLGDYEAPLSCLKNDDSLPQKFLDNAVQAGKKYYAFDEENDVFIVFQRTEGNIYHGYDEININKVPAQVRITFKKRKNDAKV